jgi:hypothetical protein
MVINSHKRGKKLGAKVQFHGIGADAAALKVSASYLWLCLTGRKDRQEIVEAYRELKRQQARQLLEQTQKAA